MGFQVGVGERGVEERNGFALFAGRLILAESVQADALFAQWIASGYLFISDSVQTRFA